MIKYNPNKIKDFTGQNFGYLTAIKPVGKAISRGLIWLCQCKCGKRVKIYGGNLTKKKHPTESCGCNSPLRRTGENNHNWKGYKEISGQYWASIKLSAKKRNIKFKISIEDAWQQYLSQNKKCFYTGEDLIIGKGQYDRNISNASLDRIDSSKDYTKDNIRWVTKQVNVAKSDFSHKEFIHMCQKVVHCQK